MDVYTSGTSGYSSTKRSDLNLFMVNRGKMKIGWRKKSYPEEKS